MKQEVSPVILAVAAVAVIAIVGFIAYKVLATSQPVPTANTKITPPPSITRESYYQGGGGGGYQNGYNSSYGGQGMSAPR